MVDFKKMIAKRRERHNIEMKPNLKVSISVAGPDYAIKFGWNGKLKDALKTAIPQSEITWHKGRRVWLVHPDGINKAVEIIQSHTGQVITLPTEKPVTPEIIEKTFLLEYLGATKDRGKRTSAYGSVNGEWSSEFPEDILKIWFEGGAALTSDRPQTLYQALCIPESSTLEQIKSAYRRLARQWHPDVCREDNATEMFRKLDGAYKILSDFEKRRRYDAGLYFERQGQESVSAHDFHRNNLRAYGYRAPLRCGQITARGTVRLMRFVVSEILKWDDVTKDGKVMISQWPKGSDTFQILWV